MNLQNKESLNNDELKIAFEQYKLYVQMADNTSQRRMNANTFFTTINTLLFMVVSLVTSDKFVWAIFVGAIGCVVSFAWYFTLNSYQQLNAGKFAVINEIEKLLPLSGFSYEWKLSVYDKKNVKYWSLSHIEKIIPIIFFIAYIVLVVYGIIIHYCY